MAEVKGTADELGGIMRDLDTTTAAWAAAGHPLTGAEADAREAVFLRLRQWNAAREGWAGPAVADLHAGLTPDQWAVILRNLENARVDNAAVLDRLHVQFGRLAPEHGCSWPGMQTANGAHRPLSSGICTCGMRWPHVAIEDGEGRYLLG